MSRRAPDDLAAEMAARRKAEYARDEAAGEPSAAPARSPRPFDNYFSHDEMTVIDNAVKAWGAIKKTFTTWMTIAEAVTMIRQKADALGGGKTFRRKLDQAGLGDLPPATCTRLIAIYDNKQAVAEWHGSLPGGPIGKQLRWASPSAVFKHCPVFAKPKSKRPANPVNKPTDSSALMAEHQELQAAYEKLKDDRKPGRDQIIDMFVEQMVALSPKEMVSTMQAVSQRIAAGFGSKATAKAPKRTRSKEQAIAEHLRAGKTFVLKLPG